MSVRDALAGGGALLVAAALLVGSLIGEQVGPLDTITPNTPASSHCHPGWADTSSRDEHTIVLSCTRDNWIVYLNSDHSFSHAWPGSGPFIFDPAQVPGW